MVSFASLVDFMSAVVTLTAAVVLGCLSIPSADQWRPMWRMRAFLVPSYLLLCLSNVASGFSPLVHMETYLLRSVVIAIAMFQALLFTTTSLTFIVPHKITPRWIGINAVCVICFWTLMIIGALLGGVWFHVVVWISVVAYICQLGYYSLEFVRNYVYGRRLLDENYDDEFSGRLLWIRHCFFTALLIGLLALLFSLFPGGGIEYTCFTLIYTSYYVYLVICIVNYRITSTFIVKVLGRNDHEVENVKLLNQIKDEKIEAMKCALTRWIENKRYIECDQTVEEIAVELGFDKTFMAWYFTDQLHTTFRAWRTELRIREAQRLLRDEDAPTASLHLKVGISDKSNFHKHFKNFTGMTPREYKEVLRRDV